MTFLKNITNNQLSDKELVLAFKQSNQTDYISILYQRYMDLVFGVCLKYFKDADRSKDAVMDIYEELCIKVRKHEVKNFKAWLHVLTRNHCLMLLRSQKNKRVVEFNSDFMQSVQITHLENEVFEKEENFKQLEACIEFLPIDQKKCIKLFFLEKKCYNEIAAVTGQDWNKIRSYIQNGKRNLKICMEEKNIFGAG